MGSYGENTDLLNEYIKSTHKKLYTSKVHTKNYITGNTTSWVPSNVSAMIKSFAKWEKTVIVKIKGEV